MNVAGNFAFLVPNSKRCLFLFEPEHFLFSPAVQDERGPRRIKTSLRLNTVEITNFKYDPKWAVPSTFQPNILLNFNALTQILITCVKQAKLNDSFLQFSMPQRQLILKNVWTECFVLRASHWPIDISPIIEQ